MAPLAIGCFVAPAMNAAQAPASSEEREFTAGERKREAQPQEEARKSRRQYQ